MRHYPHEVNLLVNSLVATTIVHQSHSDIV